MLKFECRCGNREFFVNRRYAIVQCTNCKKKFQWKDAWKQMKLKDKVKVFRKTIAEITSKPVQIILETTGQIRKTLGIQKIKKKKPISKKKIKIEKKPRDVEKELERIVKRWDWLIEQLYKEGSVHISKNEHFGSLRGKSIAKEAHRKLKRVGIKTRVNYKKNKDAEIILEQPEGIKVELIR